MSVGPQVSTEGINYGKASIEGKTLNFVSNRIDKPIFSLPLDNITTCVIPSTNKDDVEIQFQENQENVSKDEDNLVQITFHFPSRKDILAALPEGEEVDELGIFDSNFQSFEAQTIIRRIHGGTISQTSESTRSSRIRNWRYYR